MPRWLKITLKVIGSVLLLLIVLLIGILIYVNSNKKKVLAMVNTQLNKSLDGTLIIGDMEPVFFKGFPDISLSLRNVLLRDKQWNQHHHTLLDAKAFDISVNASALLRGTISINHVDISNAAIDLYTDSNGYSNTSVFKSGKPKKAAASDDNSSSAAEIRKFSLRDVSFAVNNQQVNKLFHFDIHQLAGKMDYPDTGWHADVHLKLLAKSMAFNTDNGSFIQNKEVDADLIAGFNQYNGKITVASNRFDIGGNVFKLNALFATAKGSAGFSIKLAAGNVMWRNAASLVAANISKTLDMFNMDKPIAVTADIAGSFKGGNTHLYVTAKVRDTKLSTPGGNIEACNFDGVYTNHNDPKQDYTDENSAIKLIHLKGNYNHIPFSVDTGSILNLSQPIATGTFTSNFPVSDLNYLLGSKVAHFAKGTADMKLRFKADIVDYKLNKPVIAGVINLNNADINYIPRNLNLTNTSISLHFVGNDLILNNIRLQSGRSIVLMEGRVNNFLNLYYSSPEKILLTWQVKSPQLHLAEFLGFLNSREQAPAAKKTANSGNVIDQLSNVLNNARAEMHLNVDKLFYKNFLATDANADLLLSEDGVVLKTMSLKHAGGSLTMNGQINQGNNTNKFIFSTIVSNVNIHEFFYAFDNFGLTDITYKNLKGFLSAKAQIAGGLTTQGAIIPKSMTGSISINLKNGALLNYNPLKTVGKFAFPFRNLNDIEIPVLDAKFDLHGDKITINPLKITSSVLNADIAGTYGLTNGTNIALDVPLRNPKGDSTITDQAKLDKKRYKGIVLHILAKSDETGKIKIGWNKDHK